MPTRRRWPQFSLRGFLVVLTIGCVWLGWKVERAQKQREMSVALERLGGGTSYKWEVEPHDGFGTDGYPPPDCPAPSWLRSLLSDDFLFDVSTVWMGSKATDADLELLNGLNAKRMLGLNLSSKGITDKGLEKLPPMPNLLTLAIDDSQITDEGMRHLAKFPNLKYLQMKGVAISDAGLLQLTKNTKLKVVVIGLRPKRLTDVGISKFGKELPGCKVLAW